MLLFVVRAMGQQVPADHAERMTRGLKLFTTEVAGILKDHCVKCHGGEKTRGDFDLSTREGLLLGGAAAGMKNQIALQRRYLVLHYSQEGDLKKRQSE